MSKITQPGSFKSYLRLSYGMQTQRTVNDFGKELQRVARYSNHHHFNVRCNKSGVVPPSLRMKAPVDTDRARAAAARTSRIFVQERIKVTWKTRELAVANVNTIRRSLKGTLSEEDFMKVERICSKTAEKTFQRFKSRQRQKFEGIRNESSKESDDMDLRPSWVVNLSERKLTEAEESILAKGPKFATTPRIDPIDFAAPIEAAIHWSKAPEQAKETARIKICEAIRKAKRPKNNIRKDEYEAWKNLKNDTSIKILQADKGNATVVMNAEEYDKKAHDLLDDREAYAIMKKDATQATERNLLSMLRSLKKEGKISEYVYERVRPSEGSSKPAMFYGRVKLHKASVPIRPVVSTCGTSTYKLARLLASILGPLVKSSERTLRNTAGLVDTMKEVVLDEDEILVSYDVKSLFTSVPVEESIAICERRLMNDETLPSRTTMDVATIILFLRFCLTTTSFRYNNQYFKQLDGVAMGSPISPIVADIFMQDFEDRAFTKYERIPRIWKRFVDDVIVVIRKDDSQAVLNHLNSQHRKIQFTMEEEENGSLPFMDVRFTRNNSGRLEREVYQKPTHTNRYIQYTSHHPKSVKSGVVECLARRAITVSSNEQALRKENRHIREVMRQNGYPGKVVENAINKQAKQSRKNSQIPSVAEVIEEMAPAKIPFIDGLSQEVRRIAREAGVRCGFFTPSTTISLYSVKDQLPRDSATHAIYAVECKTCGQEYVGETLRAVKVRCKEHCDAIRLGQTAKSAIAEHVHQHMEPHDMDWEKLKVIDRARNNRERKIREAFHIEQRKPAINRDAGIDRSKTWSAVL